MTTSPTVPRHHAKVCDPVIPCPSVGFPCEIKVSGAAMNGNELSSAEFDKSLVSNKSPALLIVKYFTPLVKYILSLSPAVEPSKSYSKR
ncbi:hypothetical protein DFA_06311 [Cavenderia fasciculata]|uniref:Uncharacterized protein n=1 Tax=Cavenderia fasciculata TaxID=261658 RepID=F4PKP1_CACFS|nr:uncharacterized protein DFA_06311 [Cavenderia fasciculata]EGG24165.1 hypothetical protein DFA_06311 [Cavenderia fasciculata]|eukprot:XP_004362016.1 hypothetical protein DFA_06311 [Cavenderia fasciculata]